MNLLKLCRDAGISPQNGTGHIPADFSVAEIVYDSRRAGPGCIFVCLCGANSDGHLFAQSAYARGCRCFLVQKPVDLPTDAVVLQVEDTRAALPHLSAALFDFPQKRLQIIGITGTKGKTTTASLLYQLLNASGIPSGLVGTCGIQYAGVSRPTANTTPESYELMRAFSEMLDAGMQCVVMEVSSQALFTHRVDGIRFSLAIFTNLSPDHIGPGEHRDFAHYKACKKKLFSLCDKALMNADDPAWREMSEDLSVDVQTFALSHPADHTAHSVCPILEEGRAGMGFVYRDIPYTVQLPGTFNVSNALCALAAAGYFVHRRDLLADALRQATVPGRFEQVPVMPGVCAVIDYAHNAVSMENLLRTVRSYNPKRLVCLFGSVGGRTQKRREEMGKIVAELADFAVITSDNPDFEEPEQIIRDIACWFSEDVCPFVSIADRREAIRYTLDHARPGDMLLFCGKGHEDYQLIRGVKEPFSEKKIIAQYMKEYNENKQAEAARTVSGKREEL